jgi:hypothetical protein
MDGLHEPLARPMAGVLRRAVVDHAAAERRRVYPALLHVGWPGVRAEVFAATSEDRFDQALRCDVVGALLRTARSRAPTAGAVPMVWLTRSGPLERGDLDVAWLGAALRATAEAGLGLTFVVVTKRGWFDPRTGARREWRRIRAP